MKPGTPASIGAVVLYLWREFLQASPFAFLEQGKEAQAWSTEHAAAIEKEGEPRDGLEELFGPMRLAR